MMKNGLGFVNLLVLVVLILGIGTGLVLIKNPQIFTTKASVGAPFVNSIYCGSVRSNQHGLFTQIEIRGGNFGSSLRAPTGLKVGDEEAGYKTWRDDLIEAEFYREGISAGTELPFVLTREDGASIRVGCSIGGPPVIDVIYCSAVQSNERGLFTKVSVSGSNLGLFGGAASLKAGDLQAGIGLWTDNQIEAEIYKDGLKIGDNLNLMLTRNDSLTVGSACIVPKVVENAEIVIQQKIDSLSSSGGGVVQLEPEIYAFKKSVSLKSNVSLKGVKGTRFTMSPDFVANPYQVKAYLIGSGPCVDNVSIENIYFNGKGVEAVYSMGMTFCGTNITVKNNKFTGFNRSAMYIYDTSPLMISGNSFDEVDFAGEDYGAIYFAPANYRDMIIEKNTITRTPGSSITFYTSADSSLKNIKIRENYIYGGPVFRSGGSMGIWILGGGFVEDMVIENNEIREIEAECIAFYKPAGKNIMIRNNKLTDCSYFAVVAHGAGVTPEKMIQNLTITDNQIYWHGFKRAMIGEDYWGNCAKQGIEIRRTSGTRITNNYFTNIYAPIISEEALPLSERNTNFIIQGSSINYDQGLSCRDFIPTSGPSFVPSATPSTATYKKGDVNKDGDVDIFDYNLIVTHFGESGSNLAADVDKNGKVDIFDYNIIVTNFGK